MQATGLFHAFAFCVGKMPDCGLGGSQTGLYMPPGVGVVGHAPLGGSGNSEKLLTNY